MFIFCRKVIVNKPAMLSINGPVLLACNHPNSFLDSIILDTIIDKPVWSLARGDVFRNRFIIRILTSLKILPVYRTSEGVENLSTNYKTFDDCIRLFKNNAIVMIFSEGKCINEWHLRHLKKGTARLALKAWEENVSLVVLPVGINYSSFRRFSKNVFINFGDPIRPDTIDMEATEGIRHNIFNKKLRAQLELLVLEIPQQDRVQQAVRLVLPVPAWKRILLLLPAIAGLLLHAPIYIPLKKFTWKRTYNNDHYDSVLTALLFVCYPFYVLLIAGASFALTKSLWAFFLLPALPFTAWTYVQLKPQLDKI
jgi:1-acyl-sn-glycerol-3-phosphate acyltransferase